MKIIIFDGSFATTAFIRRLMSGLVSHEQEVSVIGFNEENPKPIPGVNYQSLGSNQSKLSFIKTSLGLAFQSGQIKRIFKALNYILKGKRRALQEQNLDIVLKQIKPDILHVQWPSLLPWMEPYFKNTNFKIVLSQRGFHTNVRPFIDEDNFEYLQKCYPQLDGLHSVSQAISQVGQKIAVPQTEIDQVVYTGLDLEKINYQSREKSNKVLELLSVGRPHWKKDYSTAIKACAYLKQEDIDFHYTIIGGQGDEESLFLIHELGLIDYISLTQKLPQDEVFARMQAADIMLLPSIEEGIANVAVEAMALGTPVISTDCGGMEELITHDKEGWIVPTRDPQALAEAVKNFISLDKICLNEVTTAARLKVEQQHNENKMIKDMICLYKKLK